MDHEYLQVLEFIQNNSDIVILEPTDYVNQLTFAFSKKLYPYEINRAFFPKMRLHVERLSTEFVNQNLKLLTNIALKTNHVTNHYFNDIWVTTSEVSDRDLLLVELSFE